MNQLDDFEKYLRDQLKGHAEPDPLMWKRLTDVIGRVEPWYAKSAFKYALTSFGSICIGGILTYLLFISNPSKQQLKGEWKNKQAQLEFKNHQKNTIVKQEISYLEPTLLSSVRMAQRMFINDSSYFANQKLQDTAQMPFNGSNQYERVSIPLESQTLAFDQSQINTKVPTDYLKPNPIAPFKINNSNSTLCQSTNLIPGTKQMSISLANGKIKHQLPSYNYQLGLEGKHNALYHQANSPVLQFQFNLFKNFYLNSGFQLQKHIYTEYFDHAEVFSYDDKEHYLFPYMYGFRKISDEELHEGPWPFGPNPPNEPNISSVNASYTSEVLEQNIRIPLTLSYHKMFGVFEAQFNAGFLFQFNYRTRQNLIIPGYGTSSIEIKNPMGLLTTYAQSQMRLLYKSNKHLGIFIEPQFNATFNKIKTPHLQTERILNSGLNLGLIWTFKPTQQRL